MLDKQDLESISYLVSGLIDKAFQGQAFRSTVREEVNEAVGGILEENVLPQFDEIYKRFEQVDSKLNRIQSTMVTKDFLEVRLANFKVGLRDSARRATRQVRKMAAELHKSGVFSVEQVMQICSE